jgi:DNA-binding HxlR family transcriptional regulator
MRSRAYGQFCGLARAAEMLGQRWTLMVLRDLLVAPRRYTDLLSGLPGIPTNVLSTRLKELEQDGLILREARSGADRSVVYRLTPRGEALQPALDALARWGAADMHVPREGEVITEASLVSALRAGIREDAPRPTSPRTYQLTLADVSVQIIIDIDAVRVAPGPRPDPDLVITAGPGLREVLAGTVDHTQAVADGIVELSGDVSAFGDFVATFHVPYHSEPTTTGPTRPRSPLAR